jgi:hypothetical protein
MSVRVLIVDDQEPFRMAARMVVEAAEGFEVVGEADTGESSVEMARELDPDLVLMDVNLPGVNGLEARRRSTLPGRPSAGRPRTSPRPCSAPIAWKRPGPRPPTLAEAATSASGFRPTCKQSARVLRTFNRGARIPSMGCTGSVEPWWSPAVPRGPIPPTVVHTREG